jgi:hypothetical protein
VRENVGRAPSREGCSILKKNWPALVIGQEGRQAGWETREGDGVGEGEKLLLFPAQ